MALPDLRRFSHVFKFLDTNGDGTGDKNAIGDYSSTPTDFFYQPEGGRTVVLTRMIITMSGDHVNENGYGVKDTPLANGIVVHTENSTPEAAMDLSGGIPIRKERHWQRYCYDADASSLGLVVARWTFAKAGIPLFLSHNDRLVVTLNDDFSALTGHFFNIQGADASHGWRF